MIPQQRKPSVNCYEKSQPFIFVNGSYAETYMHVLKSDPLMFSSYTISSKYPTGRVLRLTDLALEIKTEKKTFLRKK